MTLWLGATALLIAALGFVLVPAWLRARRMQRLPITGLIVAGLLVPFTVGLYMHVSTWSGSPQANTNVPAVEDMVSGLAGRLQQNPDDVAGWRLLGQSYLALGRYTEARDALSQAWQRTPVPDDELRVAFGEAQALSDRESLAGEAGALFTEVLSHDPANQKALWYGGLAALMTQQPDVARERWSRLLALEPPAAIAEVLREQLQTLGGPTAAASAPDASSPAGPTPATAPVQAAGVRLLIRLAEGMTAEDLGSASLFIFARSPEGGPPVAVLRQSAGALPGEFALSDANAMIPGRSIGNFESLTIVARISRSGQPTEQSGDLFGQITYRPGQDLNVQEMVIDQRVP
jgi:cytochrome c-type biogenesis protein CcmH